MIANKVVSSVLGLMVDISKIRAEAEAKSITKRIGLNPSHVQLIRMQSPFCCPKRLRPNPKGRKTLEAF